MSVLMLAPSAHAQEALPLGTWRVTELADLLLVRGNPLEDLSVIVDAEANLLVIMKDGKIYKNLLEN